MHVTVVHVVVAWVLTVALAGVVYWGIREYRPAARYQRRAFVIASCLLCTPAIVPELSTVVPWPFGVVLALSLLDDPDWVSGQEWLILAAFLVATSVITTVLSRRLFPDPPTTTTQ
jgi:hypothetical protein